MSEYLAKRIVEKVPELSSQILDFVDVNYNTEFQFTCKIHGIYYKKVKSILYKTGERCPYCIKETKNKKLSEIGKTKTGEKNNFYGHTHSKETRQKLSDAWTKKDNSERKQKISNTVKSKECQDKTKKTNLERYGNENYRNVEKARQTCREHFGTNTYAESQQFKDYMSNLWKNKSKEDLDNISNKSKQIKLKKYGDANYNNRDKASQTCLDKYGIPIPNQYGSDQFKQNMEIKYGEDWTYYVGQQAAKGNINRIVQFEKEHDCTCISKLVKMYGQGWLSIRSSLKTITDANNIYIYNSEIQKIIDYVNISHVYYISHMEKEFVDYIKSIYKFSIIENSRRIINPLELDIYLPDLKLAVEFNGQLWHSNLYKCDDYHLYKSLACREKKIRLVHIYEFEDFEVQKQLLKDLINGIDNYPKKDFNKNNLIEKIPKPEIIFKTDDYIIYGAGKLY